VLQYHVPLDGPGDGLDLALEQTRMASTFLDHFSDGDRKLIREQLDRILESTPFVQSRRRQRFLEYVVHETVAGRGERLKGYNIALEVFERPETFDPVADPIVRIEAGRLREKLRCYYEAEGWNDPVRIALPRGTYRPRIMFRNADSSGPRTVATHPALRDENVKEAEAEDALLTGLARFWR
jgi:hypothetical protein